MRILLAATSTLPDRMGGGERVLWNLARGFVSRGHETRIVVPRTRPAWPRLSVLDGVTIQRYDDLFHSFATLYLPSLWLARAAIRRLIRAWRPDVVHASQGLSGLGAVLAGARPFCYTFYGPWHLEFLTDVDDPAAMPWMKRSTRSVWAPAKASFARRVEGAAVRRSDRVVVLSSFSLRQLAEVHGVGGARLWLIPGGVDLELFALTLDRRAARRALGIAGDRPLLFTVRRLVPRMGLEGLLQAVARLPGVRLVVGGAGSLRARLEQAAAALGVGDRVTFAGFIEDADLPLYYQAADLVVLPSIALEGFGLISLEALACGTPVVATPESGTTDILAAFRPAWIAPGKDPESLAGCIAETLASAAGERGLREECRAHAARYPWGRMVERHLDLYRSLTGR